MSYYGHLLGRSVALWHGDISAARKAKIVASPPDILLTTPESLEVMLVSNKVDHQQLFANVRTVIIDEVHAFAGDDRGWHLLSVLERISVLAGREIQRLGLSATVGNPDTLCDWLAGSCNARRSVINPPAENNVIPDVQVDWVGSLKTQQLSFQDCTKARSASSSWIVDPRLRSSLLSYGALVLPPTSPTVP